MSSNKIICLIFFFLLFCEDCFAERDTNNLRFSFSIGRIFPKYFLQTDNENATKIKSASVIENSAFCYELNLKTRRLVFSVGYHNIKRNFTIEYKEDINNIKETYFANSQLSSLQFGLNYLIKKNHVLNFYFITSLIYAKGWNTEGKIDFHNVKTNQNSQIVYYPHQSLNGYTTSFSSGLNIEINLYKNVIFSKNQLLFAKNLFKTKFPNGVDRILISSGLNFTIFNEN